MYSLERTVAIPSESPKQFQIPQRFGPGFWADHAGLLIKDPQIAIVELVANSWDAGADRVDIAWPSQLGDAIEVRDNGVGMSYEEFSTRWNELNYNRIEGGQGTDVRFPSGKHLGKRKAYGRNGKGRHSMFCFSYEYFVETWKNNKGYRFRVEKTSGEHPFIIEVVESFLREGSGTSISAQLLSSYVTLPKIRTLIGTKFIADPAFNIFINGEQIKLEDIEASISRRIPITIRPYGTVTLLVIDSKTSGRTSQQHGVAWWVNKRVVGVPSWEGIEITKYLDRRWRQARRYTFVVHADILHEEVKADWTWFHNNSKTQSVIASVNEEIQKQIALLFDDVRLDRKKNVLRENKAKLTNLSELSRARVGQFLDGLQVAQPAIAEKDLSAAVGVMANLEAARTGYKLLEQLARLSPDDFDSLSELLSKWSVNEMAVVLDELERRLRLIKELEAVVETKSDELHEIHPLFERGLWIFGPEYEAVSYISNRSLGTVIRKFLLDKRVHIEHPATRPDLVVIPDSSIIRVFSQDEFSDEEDGEVAGIEKVLIIELKKGNSEISIENMWQARGYADAIKQTNKVSSTTEIKAFVLGTTIGAGLDDPITQGNTKVIAMPYSTILRKAHSRTFNLLKRLQENTGRVVFDVDIDAILNEVSQELLI